jgi:hypothetical protein
MGIAECGLRNGKAKSEVGTRKWEPLNSECGMRNAERKSTVQSDDDAHQFVPILPTWFRMGTQAEIGYWSALASALPPISTPSTIGYPYPIRGMGATNRKSCKADDRGNRACSN